jgi:hypothetical protein
MKFDVNDLEGGPFESLEDLNKALAAHFEKMNNRAVADFQGLSPTQMHILLLQTFQPDSPLKVKTPTSDQLARIPFFLLTVDLLKAVQVAGQVKATSKGNLPVALCKELYAKKHILHEMIESGITKAYKEEDYPSIHAAHIVSKQAGFLRLLKGKILLTKKGEKLLQPEHQPTLFQELLEIYCKKYNWAYLDGIENQTIAQTEMGYLLFILSKFGDQEHKSAFYAEKCFQAFPILNDVLGKGYFPPLEEFSHAVEIRFLHHFAAWFGLATAVVVENVRYQHNQSYQKTALMDELFGFVV